MDDDGATVHRIRHIDSVQIRNLTPFPARDALTTALAQPQLPKHAAATQDDIELTLSRRRRRISTTSASTLRSVFSQDSADDGVDRPRLAHRASSASNKSMPSSAPRQPVALPTALAPADSSQRGLEKVIASRLLETFVTFAASRPAADAAAASSVSRPTSPISPTTPARARAHSVKRTGAVPHTPTRRGASISSIASVTRPPKADHRDGLVSPTRAQFSPGAQTKTAVKTSRRTSLPPVPVSPPPTPRNSMIIPSTSSTRQSTDDEQPPQPFFKSAVHRPSTNPAFDVSDAKAAGDLGSSRLIITLWGRTVLDPDTFSQPPSRKGKEREGSSPISSAPVNQWRVLCEYDLDLNDLQPMPAEYTKHPSRLPSNTLVLHLTPPDQTFFLPPTSLTINAPSSRPASPGAEALSDGELDLGPSTVRGKRPRRKSAPNDPPQPPAKTRTTATWHDLHKLVHLQSTLADTQQNLEKIVANCNALLRADTAQPAKREISEREERLRALREQRDIVRAQCRNTEALIEARRKDLEDRRQMLASARDLVEQERAAFESTVEVLSEQEHSCKDLTATIETRRADLLQTLCGVYPIEPLSAPDLLFSILGVALPVPQNNTDPAPPLSLTLSDVNVEVNEETVAASLGYVAQLVHLMAKYLGRRLMYPVTCVGSRSLIKDPISAMMGPRMFPLYSKGVETYRFEYAVFLLNKDIELMMMDRNLRALDLRHTLPNLMNLLLTLTGPDAEPPHKHRRRPVSPQLSVKELHPPPAATHAAPARQASESEIVRDLPAEQPSSHAAVPSTPGERRSMFSPLAAMLRARYPSSAARVTIVEPVTSPPTTPAADGDVAQPILANGNGNGDATRKADPSSATAAAAPSMQTPAAKASRMGGMFGRFMGSATPAEEKVDVLAKSAPGDAEPTPSQTAAAAAA
ncbi:hypothetical protein EXIGLDRAFT_834201 [Exidia glandulosa HHB12029]|uniref:Autophagy-related protein 14 n=1 Tax=Exidia glandulosa HHB12029 TaxID=1314781 RepID=A0A165K063_EXIGL|nr:hypothetical protein EXIGLDRAFT_834201 [Exidia glandulosa HHB12029]